MSKSREVAEYLKNNPGFFAEHQELLADIEFSPPEAGPFHERQVQVLKDRQAAERARLEMFVDTARNNQDLQNGLHQVATTLLAASANDPAEAVTGLVCQRFGIDEARIFTSTSDDEAIDYALLSQRVAHLGSVCDDRASSRLRGEVFAGGEAIESIAFVPLSVDEQLLGVMVLGSREADRFTPDMGVMFLDRLGQLAGAYLAGCGHRV